MRFTSKLSWAAAIMAVIAVTTSAADARPSHVTHQRYAPNAFEGAYNAYGNGYRGTSEARFGSSVPYDADGPGYNDFQLQGR